MIFEDNYCKLIKIYFFISDNFIEIKHTCERFSNNKEPDFTDQELMTIYLYATLCEGRSRIKEIYDFTKNHLHSWFPKLISYQAFNRRLNRLTCAFEALLKIILINLIPTDCILDQSLIDSMPIITCSGKRSGKVARNITNKGFCSTKNLYYYGLKLHFMGYRRIGKLPHPEQIILTPASENDLTVFKENWTEVNNRTFWADKIYYVKEINEYMLKQNNSEVLSPIKKVKGETEEYRQSVKSANDLYSTAVSRVRQPVESIFNWLIEKTDIQRASKVRSDKGLLLHMFGKLASAFLTLIF